MTDNTNDLARSTPRQAGSRTRFNLLIIVNVLLIAVLACSLPGLPRSTATPTGPATQPAGTFVAPLLPTPSLALPAGLVEADPPPGSEIPLNAPITLYFNQAMDRASVENAFSGQPTLYGSINWIDDSTLTFIPDASFLPDTDLVLNIGAQARSKRGVTLQEPLSFTYRTVGFLQLAQALPEPGSREVDPASAIVSAFNRPVVSLGGDQAIQPVPFQIEPAAQGQGEWVNTSTYIFYPEPPLAGGVTYTVRIDPGLQGTDGSPLQAGGEEGGLPLEWSFSTASPRVVVVEPAPDMAGVRLDGAIQVTFNQPMDAGSVAANFALMASGTQPTPGQISWNEDFTLLTFTPSASLARDTAYMVVLNAGARARGGTALGKETQSVFFTVPGLAIAGHLPAQGESQQVYQGVTLNFSSHLPQEDLLRFFTFSPPIPNLSYYLEFDQKTLHLYGDFAPDTVYTLVAAPGLTDMWGGSLGQAFTLNFRTAPLDPDLQITLGSDTLFLTPQDQGLTAQATNLFNLPISVGSVPLEDFRLMFGSDNYEFRQSYQPTDLQTWSETLSLTANRSQPVTIPLSPEGSPLAPGLYMLRFGLLQDRINQGPYLLVVSNVQLAFKVSARDALVWAIDLRQGTPVADAPVSILDEEGNLLAEGQTDPQGVFRTDITALPDPYANYLATLGKPGQDIFSLALSTWNQGIAGWDFGIPVDAAPPGLKTYLYTDRPIYRPGQVVYYRAIVRQAFNGRYSLPELNSLPLTVYNDFGQEQASFDLPLSAYGSAQGEFTLPLDAQPGYYRLGNDQYSIFFQVAEYRKPEINLQVDFIEAQVQAGQNLTARVNARYFFDAPAGGTPVQWALYAMPDNFSLPGYQTGAQDDSWLGPYPFWDVFGGPFGEQVSQGEGRTGPDGLVNLEFSTGEIRSRQRYTLEVTIVDESQAPVSARAVAIVNPGEFYIGVRPDAWVGQAGSPTGFDLLVVDWQGNPAGERALSAEFKKVVWVRQDSQTEDPYAPPDFIPEYTLVDHSQGTTAPDGAARLVFTPPEPGTYQLDVSGEGSLTQVILWVGGPGQAVWPNLGNERLHLVADQESYRPGQTAQVFVPNPFEESVQALVTVERGVIMRHWVVAMDGNGLTLPVPLSAEDAPNVYLSVVLIGRDPQGRSSFRQGYLNLPVEPVEQSLLVSLVGEPPRAGPGDTVTLTVRVTDPAGQPVVGEFSLSVVDLAVLALADPNAQDILPAFYGEQPLGVRTGLSLAAHAQRASQSPLGRGGGGGGGEAVLPVVREEFPDTAYWEAQIITDSNGEARVTVSLPDNLTTWQVDVRGLTQDTRVGQAKSTLVATKELLVRPVTPRFLVAHDHLQLAAVIHNNTTGALLADVALQAAGFVLDDASTAIQQVDLPAGGRARVEWWGLVEDVESADLLFSARAGLLQDAVRPAQGALPVLQYATPQTFATAGILEQGGERLELVSLPRLAVSQGNRPAEGQTNGELSMELSPSLAAVAMNALQALEHFPQECTEQTLSRFLPNLETYRAMQTFGIESPELKARLDRTLKTGLDRLLSTQNQDGGWGWWPGGVSHPYVSAYVLFGLNRAVLAGTPMNTNAIERAVSYLYTGLLAPEMTTQSWELNRLAFTHYVLAQAGSGDLFGVVALYDVRNQLDPWAQAWLALALESLSPGDERARTLISDLQAGAIRSATGAHWDDRQPDRYNMSTPVFATAAVVYALAQREPASSLLPEAVRYLVAHRQSSGGWPSTFESAWSLMALAEYMKGTGELSGNFAFSARLNGASLATGQAVTGNASISPPVTARVPLSALYSDYPNALEIQREPGSGRLYYSARLRVNVPAETATPLNRGLSISRRYYPFQNAPIEDVDPVRKARIGEVLTVQLTLVLPKDAYYLLVEDFIPAGTEILDTSLQTSQLGLDEQFYDPRRPYEGGWGWWYFQRPSIHDNRIAWAAEFLPAGTYVLTYQLNILQPGEYQVLPAHAWQFYFPEVQGASAGEMFVVQGRD